jgi:hypothetical protein
LKDTNDPESVLVPYFLFIYFIYLKGQNLDAKYSPVHCTHIKINIEFTGVEIKA